MNKGYAVQSMRHIPDLGLDGELRGPGGLEFKTLGVRNSYPQALAVAKASGCVKLRIYRIARRRRR